MNNAYKIMLKKVKKYLKQRSKTFYPWLKKLKAKGRLLKYKSKIMCYGDKNPDKIFYVINRYEAEEGLFSYVNNFAGHMKYAIDKGWIPVVDMQNYRNSYLDEEDFGKVNAWELYFEQPCGYTLEDVYQSKKVIIGKGLPSPYAMYNEDNTITDEWREFYCKYVRVKKTIQDDIDKEYSLAVAKEERVLGINVRGTDYVMGIPGLHIQPSVEEVLEKAKQLYQNEQYDKVFICCEDKEVVERFSKTFPGKAFTNNRELYSDKDSKIYLPNVRFNRENDTFLKGKDYLTTVVMLSKCDALIGGFSGASLAAMLWRYPDKQYEYIWSLGRVEG